jgi:hypothetical protein
LYRIDDNIGNTGDDHSQIISIVDGVLTLKDQLNEYSHRGKKLEYMNFLEFMLDTYDAFKNDSTLQNDNETQVPKRGRPFNCQVKYEPELNKPGCCRVICTEGHETLPQFTGKWMPRNDQPWCKELYCSSILALLKPWISLSDLKKTNKTFWDSFQFFLDVTPKKTKDNIDNIQYFYKCYNNAKKN